MTMRSASGCCILPALLSKRIWIEIHTSENSRGSRRPQIHTEMCTYTLSSTYVALIHKDYPNTTVEYKRSYKKEKTF